ncbi:MAG TPA: cysteine--tRNA ligase [Planctomycetaceae bacterium]|nr:cysteine--tRNA ligase [Planctomycetaceae bacterium]
MDIRFYNTLTNEIAPFEPLTPGQVKMYSCGPTVYDFAHVGNFRSFLFADLLRRFLEAAGFDVWHVMNITDVGHMTADEEADGSGEDKMQVAARRLKEDKKSGKVEDGAVADPDDPYQVADYFMQAFLEDGRQLGLKVASEFPKRVPKATEYIDEIQQMISTLIARKHAYVGSDGVVYYSVESFPNYGQLSGNTLDALRVGAGGRIDAADQGAKRHPADFMLWKADPKHIMKWDSPWGAGYPGWHIECSTMSMRVLETDVLDIHTGGEDLIFPHHECEIAQSCGATGKDLFARFWMHARFLLVEGEKMSKRKGNFFTVRDILAGKATGGPVHPAVLRMELIKSHYRAHTNFTAEGLSESANTVRRLTELGQRLHAECGGKPAQVDRDHPVVRAFLEALANDLKVSEAMTVVHAWMSSPGEDAAEAYGVLLALDQVLGVWELTGADEASEDPESEVVQKLCELIDEARQTKDFSAADAHRQRLIELGYEVRSSAEGTFAQKKLA